MLVATLVAALLQDPPPAEGLVEGIVFHDGNGNGARDPGEAALPNVPVSNGADLALTDGDGRYRLHRGHGRTLFVVKPAGWATPLSAEGLPRHFHSLAGWRAGESLDFALVRQEEPRAFRVLCFGDTQSRTQAEVDFLAHDLVEELAGSEAAFGLTLGDLVFDDLSLFQTTADTVGLIGLPWHHVIGNHDLDFDTPDPEGASATYERFFGPDTYAFNVADAHFIVLNDVRWDPASRSYRGGLGERRLAFLAADLALVPEDKLVVLLMHIPLVQVEDADRLLALLHGRPHTLSLAAHWHEQRHLFLETGEEGAAPHHHVVLGTACGSWWSGHLDEAGLPHATMSDGSPNGYAWLEIDGNDYRLGYRAARRPATYQIAVDAPEEVAASAAGDTFVTANFFFGSERALVEMRWDEAEDWIPMERFEGDSPTFGRLMARDRELGERLARLSGLELDADGLVRLLFEYTDLLGRPLLKPRPTNHLWRAPLPKDPRPGSHLIHVRAHDQFGRTHAARRVIRIL